MLTHRSPWLDVCVAQGRTLPRLLLRTIGQSDFKTGCLGRVWYVVFILVHSLCDRLFCVTFAAGCDDIVAKMDNKRF